MCSAIDRTYTNFLQERQREFSNFLWVSRGLDLKIAYKQIVKPSPKTHKQAVLNSPKILELVTKEVEKDGNLTTKAELLAQIDTLLEEIAYKKNLKIIRWLGYTLTKIYLKLNSGIIINPQTVQNVRAKMGNCPLIFVPTHRSYADFITMSYVLFTYNIEIPAIAAGMDFHGMTGMGTVLRNTGAFFMRRSYNNDSLYWTTFKEYVHQLVVGGDLPIEFFIEGTRSRSCKSLPPKFGLISMILRAFFLGEVPDVLFVPINISYDRVLEEGLFAYELLGVPKPKESTAGFFKSLKILKEKFGNIYFHCGDPVSAKEFFGDKLDRSVHNLRPLHQQEITDNEKQLIPVLAHEIIHRQQIYTVLTPFNLISLILFTNLSLNKDLLSLNELLNEVVWLKNILETFGAFVYMPDVQKSVYDTFEVHKNKICLTKDGKVDLMWNNVVLDKTNIRKFKAHHISDDVMSYSVPFIMLQIYINPLLHYLIDAALIVIILKHHKRILKRELYSHYHFLRYLLSLEFVTFSYREQIEYNQGVVNCQNMNLIKLNEDYYELGSNEKLATVLFNCIEPFLTSYSNICNVLLNGPSIIDEKTVLEKVQIFVEKILRERQVFLHPYCLNLDTLTNCLNVFTSNKVLLKSRNNGTSFYEVNKDNLREIKVKLSHYIVSLPNESKNMEQKVLLQNKL